MVPPCFYGEGPEFSAALVKGAPSWRSAQAQFREVPLPATSILIVDDDVGMLRRLGAAFAVAEYEVHAATDGEIGLRRFTDVAPDAVLIDILMPTREGLETIVAMRQQRPDVTIIAMSGGGRIGPYEFLHVARHLGADAVIAKPFRLADVLALVSQTQEKKSRSAAEVAA